MIHTIHVQTRISQQDKKKLQRHLNETGMTQADAVREAMRWYLKHYETLQHNERESKLVKSIDKMANRICAMLARQGTDIGTLYELTWLASDPETFTAALNKTKERLRKRMTADEKALSERMKKAAIGK